MIFYRAYTMLFTSYHDNSEGIAWNEGNKMILGAGPVASDTTLPRGCAQDAVNKTRIPD